MDNKRPLIEKILLIKNKYEIIMGCDGEGFFYNTETELIDILNRVLLYELEEQINDLCIKRNTLIMNSNIDANMRIINFLES